MKMLLAGIRLSCSFSAAGWSEDEFAILVRPAGLEPATF